jgi:RNA polymerase sigma factor (TIGR02999 family)
MVPQAKNIDATPPYGDDNAVGTFTRLIGRVDAGENGAQTELCELVYDELRGVARKLRRRSESDSLATTDVVHEFVGRLLADKRLGQMRNRRYFYAAATDQMRQLLIDHWRHNKAQKRGGNLQRENLDPWLDQLAHSTAIRCGGDLEALDAALAKLKHDRPRQFEIVQLKFFAGLTNEQVAETLEISVDTVKRDWKVARARLGALLSETL